MSQKPQGQTQQTPPQPPVQPAPGAEPPEARTFAMLCHLGALAVCVLPTLGQIIGPLVFWLIKKDKYPLVDDQGKESLNFQITMTLAGLAGLILFVTVILIPLAILVWLAVGIFDLVMVIMASVKANSGERYRYPLCIRFIK